MSVINSSMEHVGPSSAVGLADKGQEGELKELIFLKNHLNYDPCSGSILWKKAVNYHSETEGKEAGRLVNGYLTFQIGGRKYRNHRVAWLFSFGYWPEIIDHINGDTLDNRLCNLRNVTRLENAQNHSKIKKTRDGLPLGVKALKSGNYQARASCGGQCYALGSFKTPEQAHERYKQFVRRNHDNPAVSGLV